MEHNFRSTLTRTLVVLACLGAFASLPLLAQRTTGTLGGQVLDPQGAAVGNAQVTVTNTATGVSQERVTTSAGTYSIASILPGSYTVAVEAKGFKRYVRTVQVLADQENVADARLDVGAATETVEVSGEAAPIETTSSALNNNYDSNSVLNIPVSGGATYSALNLAVLAPNTIAQPGGVTGVGGAIGGTRPRENNFTVDGVDDNNLGVTGPNSTVPLDAVDQFALQTNQFSAEYGHSAGGQFTLLTKSGTNSLHGSGQWYAQNRNFNSIDNLTHEAIAGKTIPGQPNYDNNRFGGTIGGPIIKSRFFFFGAYEYTDLHGSGTATPLKAPTASGLAQLNTLAADSAVTNILKNFPVAPANDAGTVTVNGNQVPIGNLIIISPVLQHEHDAVFNTDYTFGQHQIGTRFLFNQEVFINPVNSTQAQFNQNEPVRNRKIALTDSWTINNRVVNELRLQYSYYSLALANPCSPSTCPQDVTINELGGVTIGPSDVQTQKQNTYQIVDSLSWVKGQHTFKFGGQYSHYIYPQFFLPRSNSDNQYLSTQAFIKDLIPDNQGRTLRNAGTGSFLGTQSSIFGFVQDDVKATTRLTLNLGLRYEFWTNPVGAATQALNAISNVPGLITFGVPKTDKNNIAPRIGFAYDPAGNGKTSIRGGFGISYGVKFQNFASITLPPQLQSELNPTSACSLTPTPSWCATGTGFLAGGGLPQTYIPPTGQAGARALTTSFIDDTVMPKILTWSLGVQHEILRNSTIEVRYLGTRGLELPVQFRRNRHSFFDGGGTPLPTYLNASSIPATFSASTPTDEAFYGFQSNFYRPLGFRANITADPPLGNSIYHAGSVSFTQRSRRGLTFNANYTYAHTIDTATNEFFTSFLNPRRAQDTTHLGDDRANSDLDVRHKFALSLAYDLPKTTAGNGFLRALMNGYSLGSTVLAQTGQPITLQSGGVDSNGNGDSAGDRVVFNPNGIGNTGSDVFPVCEGPGGLTYVGATAFTVAANNGCNNNPNTLSGGDPAIGYTPVNPKAKYVIAGAGARTTVGRNSFTSPGFWVWNLSAAKKVNFTESKYLQVQAQVFNILNHPNYALSNGNVFSTAGVTTATSTPGYAFPTDTHFLDSKLFSGGIRSMVLGLKFVF